MSSPNFVLTLQKAFDIILVVENFMKKNVDYGKKTGTPFIKGPDPCLGIRQIIKKHHVEWSEKDGGKTADSMWFKHEQKNYNSRYEYGKTFTTRSHDISVVTADILGKTSLLPLATELPIFCPNFSVFETRLRTANNRTVIPLGVIDIVCYDVVANEFVIIDVKTVERKYPGKELTSLIVKRRAFLQVHWYAKLFEYAVNYLYKNQNIQIKKIRVALLGIDPHLNRVGFWELPLVRGTDPWFHRIEQALPIATSVKSENDLVSSMQNLGISDADIAALVHEG